MEFSPKLLPVRQVAWSRAVRFSKGKCALLGMATLKNHRVRELVAA